MRLINRAYLLLLAIFIIPACKTSEEGLSTKTATDANGYTYEYVSGDLSNTRVYTLDNGLKAYLSVYKNAPRIQTCIPVKAGGKNDPENSTGLAHYLEHMMFKGTGTFGTKDWESEKVLLDEIEQLFEEYRTITDPDERKAHYKKIDEKSNEASKFAIANEYDKMVQYIGAKGTNAYTTEDRTVYINDIPSNQVENWLKLEANRFEMIVNRLFHTELETVYEEKNRSLDNDYWKTAEKMFELMFDEHKYGSQTVIGSIEHLKNPSITDINAYFYKYYVPNNMAICMSGDFDPDETIKLIQKYWGDKETKSLEVEAVVQETPRTSIVSAEIFGPDAERVNLGFRMGGRSSGDYAQAMMVDYMLNNASAGLIDLDLVQAQKILGGGCTVRTMNDYSIHQFFGNPREGQTLDEVKDLLISQIDRIKKGDFEDWLMEAIVNNFKKDRMQSMEQNWTRANNQVMAFTNDMPWIDYVGLIPQMEAVTKEQLIKFVQDNYKDNYAIVYKRTGKDPNKIQVEKPAITKVDLDRDTKSPFFDDLTKAEVAGLQPVFIDYDKDLAQVSMKSDIPVIYKENEENEIFTLYYLLEKGTNENPKLKYALNYLEYLGTNEKAADEIKKELYKLACGFNVFSAADRVYVYLSGLQENMIPAMELFEDLLQNPKMDQEVLTNMISDAHKSRSDSKKNKGTIFWQGLQNYATYGEDSPFTNVLSNQDLNSLHAEELIDIIKSIQTTEHTVMYYGPMGSNELISALNKHHRVPEQLTPIDERTEFQRLDTNDPQVFWTDYDMVQAEVLFHHGGQTYDKQISPEARFFNEYFGGMSGIAFQEIREAQGLAYSVFGGYNQARRAGEQDKFMAYVGTQADKQEEAMDAMMNLLNDLPESEITFENAKKGILETIESERLTKTRLFFNYLDAKQKNLDYDIRKDIYAKVKNMSFADLKKFHETYIKDKSFNIAVIGDEDKLNFAALGKYGKVNQLTLAQLFGYEEHIKENLN